MKVFYKALVMAVLFLSLFNRLFADKIYDDFLPEFASYLKLKNIDYEPSLNVLKQSYGLVKNNYVIKLSDDEKKHMLEDVFTETKKEVEERNGNIASKELTRIIMTTFLNNLDKYSIWFNKEEANTFNAQLDGSYKGIGIAISVEKNTDDIIVSQVYKNSKAHIAGIKPGDKILKVDGTVAEKGNTDQVASLIRGKQGTYVELIVERNINEENKTLTFSVKRDIVNLITSEIFFINDDILYIDIDYFNRPVLMQFKDFFSSNEKPFSSVIIDLRDNPGGLFYETIQILNSIIDEGVVVAVQISDEEDPVSYVSRTGSVFGKDIPIIVLVNDQTASSAEIFAGAMQDNEAGTIMGLKTYGKGSIQTIFDIEGGSALKITTELFYTPSHYSIQNQGVTPNILITNIKSQESSITQDDTSSVIIDKKFRKSEVEPSSSLSIKDCNPYKDDSLLGCAIDYLAEFK